MERRKGEETKFSRCVHTHTYQWTLTQCWNSDSRQYCSPQNRSPQTPAGVEKTCRAVEGHREEGGRREGGREGVMWVCHNKNGQITMLYTGMKMVTCVRIHMYVQHCSG